MKKKKYEGLALEVVGLDAEDVITTSVTVIGCNGNSSTVVCSQPGFPSVIPVGFEIHFE